MILKMENTGCKRCGSADTKLEVLIPGRNVKRREEKHYSTEIFCKDCGKIDRTEMPVAFQ